MMSCPHGANDHGNENDYGDAESTESCDWIGKCEQLKHHERECRYVLIQCTMAGCDKKLYRKDMTSHRENDHKEGEEETVVPFLTRNHRENDEGNNGHLSRNNQDHVEANRGYHTKFSDGRVVIVIDDD